jgi:GT2 family glycosyltransferase
MNISIIIPSWNNKKYLQKCIESIQLNSFFKHEIIVHLNEGTDGSKDYLDKIDIKYSKSNINIGICSAVNLAYKKTNNNYILYSNDDMYFAKNWDKKLDNEISELNHNFFYITAKTISSKNDIIQLDCGKNIEEFNQTKFDNFCNNDQSPDLRASHLCPFIIHKEIWDRVGGFSEEFDPGDGSDPDFCMKLWKQNIRVFKCLSSFKIYHFGSITTRRKNFKINNGTKTFILKWGFSPKYFRKYYLGAINNTIYDGPLKNKKLNLKMFIDLILDKIKYLVYKFL